MIRRSLVLSLVASAGLAGVAGSQGTRVRVYRAADIAAAGWHRLGDIATALPPGSTASVDGFNHLLTSHDVPFAGSYAAYTSPSTTPSWTIRLNGQRMPMVIGGTWILDAIPVAMPQIDSIVVRTGPRIVDGRASFLGVIDLYAGRAPRGLSAVADYQHGDESGDPGPYRYTADGNANVEKLGPSASFVAGAGGSAWSLQGAARYASLNITDPHIADRFPGVFPGLQHDVNASGGSGMLTGSWKGGSHQLSGGRGRFTGLLLVPSLQREESARVVATSAGITGRAPMRPVGLRYAATVTRLDTRERGSPLPFTIGHVRDHADILLEAGTDSGSLSAGIGAGAVRATLGANDETRIEPRAWASYENAMLVNYRPTEIGATLAVQRQSGELQLSADAYYGVWLRDSQYVRLGVAALNAGADADGGWADRFGVVPAHARRLRIAEMRGELTSHANRVVVPTVYASWRLLEGVRQTPFPTDRRAEGTQIAGMILSTAPGFRVGARLQGEIASRSGRGDVEMASTPPHWAQLDLSTAAPGGFLLAIAGRYAGGTHWTHIPQTPRYVPIMRRLDFSVNKSLWRERVRAQLVVRNLLDADEMHHPLGAQWNLRSHLALTVRLPPYTAVRTRAE